jgi:hypothetical protein
MDTAARIYRVVATLRWRVGKVINRRCRKYEFIGISESGFNKIMIYNC